MRRYVQVTGLAVVSLAFAWTSIQAGTIHEYDLNNTYADSLGGPSLTGQGGILSASGYTFDANQGLTLENWITGTATDGNYTIDMVFSFSKVNGYNRVLDFKDRASDTGLYILDGRLNFYNLVTGSDQIAADTLFRVDLTRDGATGEVAGYLNGVQQFTFSDSSSLAVFDATNNIINFFIDDTAVPDEASGGFADSIRIFDSALSASEVAALGPVPEPASLAMLGLGLSALGIESLRRRRNNAR